MLGSLQFRVTAHKGEGDSFPPVAVVLSDQHFPSILPSRGAGGCIFVVRIEHGRLDKLVNTFLEFARGGGVSNGSTLLLGSVRHLAISGQQG